MKQFGKQWRVLLSAGLYCLVASTSALAAIDGVRLVGLAMHQDTGRNIYLGALHYDDQIPMPADLVAAKGPRAMEYRVVARRTSIRSLMGSILLQAELATGTSPGASTINFAGDIMAAVKGSLYAGDSLEIRLQADNSVTAFLDGHELARSEEKQVADYFLMGWVGEGGPSTAFLRSILATDIDSSLLPIYEAHTASRERIAAIGSWSTPDKPSGNELVPVTETAVAAVAASATTTPEESLIAVPPVQTAQVKPEPGLSGATEVNTAGTASTASKKIQQLEPDSPSSEPVLLASISPSREMIQPALEETTTADIIGAMEYSQRLATFNTQVLKNVYAQIRYPKAAVRRNIQGTLELDLSVDKAGNLLEVGIAVSSGHGVLDKSAVKAATQAFSQSPMENIDQVAIAEYSEDGERLVIPIPVSFILTE